MEKRKKNTRNPDRDARASPSPQLQYWVRQMVQSKQNDPDGDATRWQAEIEQEWTAQGVGWEPVIYPQDDKAAARVRAPPTKNSLFRTGRKRKQAGASAASTTGRAKKRRIAASDFEDDSDADDSDANANGDLDGFVLLNDDDEEPDADDDSKLEGTEVLVIDDDSHDDEESQDEEVLLPLEEGLARLSARRMQVHRTKQARRVTSGPERESEGDHGGIASRIHEARRASHAADQQRHADRATMLAGYRAQRQQAQQEREAREARERGEARNGANGERGG